MRRCKICGKLLKKGEKKICQTCTEFHQYKYDSTQMEKVQNEYERWCK